MENMSAYNYKCISNISIAFCKLCLLYGGGPILSEHGGRQRQEIEVVGQMSSHGNAPLQSIARRNAPGT